MVHQGKPGADPSRFHKLPSGMRTLSTLVCYDPCADGWPVLEAPMTSTVARPTTMNTVAVATAKLSREPESSSKPEPEPLFELISDDSPSSAKLTHKQEHAQWAQGKPDIVPAGGASDGLGYLLDSMHADGIPYNLWFVIGCAVKRSGGDVELWCTFTQRKGTKQPWDQKRADVLRRWSKFNVRQPGPERQLLLALAAVCNPILRGSGRVIELEPDDPTLDLCDVETVPVKNLAHSRYLPFLGYSHFYLIKMDS